VVLLKKLTVTLLDVLHEAVLGRHLVVIPLLAVLHVLGIACREHSPRVVHQMLAVTHSGQALAPRHVALILNREQGNGGAGKTRQVALTELHEGLVGSPLQGAIEVITGGRGEPGRHAQVRRVSRDIHVDLTTSTPELTVRVTTVRGSPCVAKTVKHVLEQGQEAGTVQPIATVPSVGLEGGIGVVVHLSTTRKKQIIISSTEQRQQTRTQKKQP
jgi:hypothetical protein